MSAIALLFLVEKNWRQGLLATRLAGLALLGLGAAVVAVPSLLVAISN